MQQGNNITLAMPGTITFATNSADLNASFYPVLDKVSSTLVQYDTPDGRQQNRRVELTIVPVEKQGTAGG